MGRDEHPDNDRAYSIMIDSSVWRKPCCAAQQT
jgi:hypothetical protein